MDKRHKQLGQYIFENHVFDGTPDEFLDETAPLIGYIVHSFNSLDEELNSSICELINNRTDELGAIVIYKMSFSSKVELFNRLIRTIEVRYGEEIPTFKSLIADLKKCATLRNAVIHAEWENMNEDGYTYVKMNFDKQGMQQQYWQFTPDSLEEIDEFIYITYMKFDKYVEEKQKMLSC